MHTGRFGYLDIQIVGYLLEQLYFKISWLKFKPENPSALEKEGGGGVFSRWFDVRSLVIVDKIYKIKGKNRLTSFYQLCNKGASLRSWMYNYPVYYTTLATQQINT